MRNSDCQSFSLLENSVVQLCGRVSMSLTISRRETPLGAGGRTPDLAPNNENRKNILAPKVKDFLVPFPVCRKRRALTLLFPIKN